MKSKTLISARAALSGIVLLSICGLSAPLQAQSLSLPALPSGCTYTENRLHPLQDAIKISAATPLFAAVGDAPKTVASIGIQCDGPQDTGVNLSLAPAASTQWAGPSRDILVTDVPGIGIRLITESESDGAACGQQGVLSASHASQCSLNASGSDTRRMTFSVKAQVVKTGNNTPLQMRKTLQPATGGGLLLTVNAMGRQTTELFSQGLFSPAIVTAASCTLITEQTQTVAFGQIYRPKQSSREHTLGEVRTTPIEVACYPQREAGANDYNVSVIFSAGEPWKSSNDALATSVDDLAIRFSDKPDGDNWLKFGESHPIAYKAESGDRSHFSQTWYWFLRYMPEGDHQKTGELKAVATYTITIQ